MTAIFQRSSACRAHAIASLKSLLATLTSMALFFVSAGALAAQPDAMASANVDRANDTASDNSILFRVDKTPEDLSPSDTCDDGKKAAFDALAKRAEANLTSVDAAIFLIQAQRLAQDFQGFEPLVRLSKKFCSSSKAEQRVRELACGMYVTAERHRGRLGKSEAALNAMGTIVDFAVIGPFDNEGKLGCQRTLPPEEMLDLTQELSGKVRPVQWRPLPKGFPAGGRLALSDLFTPSTEAVGLAFTELSLDRDVEVVMSVESEGALQLFLDGAKILDDPEYHEQGFEQNRLQLKLTKGRHQLLVKVCSAAEGNMGFSLRILDKRGRVPSGLKVIPPNFADENTTCADESEGECPQDNPPSPPVKVASQKVAVTKLETLAQVFRKRMDRAPKDGRAAFNYALVSSIYRDGDRSERRAISASAKAAFLQPKDVETLRLASKWADKWTDEFDFLSQLLEVNPGDQKAAIRLSKMVSLSEQSRRALDILDQALRIHPGDISLELARARLLASDFSLKDQARAIGESLLEKCPHSILVLDAVAIENLTQMNPRRSADLLRTATSLDYADVGDRRILADILLTLGDPDGAADEIRRVLELLPWSARDWLKLGQILGVNGRRDEALQAIGHALSINPENAAIQERAGKILSFMKMTDEALSCFQRSLELKPQNPSLREAIHNLTKSHRSFGMDMGTDAKALLATYAPRDGEDAVVLEELTAIHVYDSGLAQRFSRVVARAQTQRGVQMLQNQWVTQSDRQDVKLLAAKIHKPDGRVIESYKKTHKSLSDPSISLYYDVRANIVSFPSLAPGDALEIAWRIEDTSSDNLLSDYFGDIHPVRGTSIKERFVYALKMPKGRKLYTSTSKDIPLEATQEEVSDGERIYKFTASNLSKIVSEPLMASEEELSGLIHVSTYENWEDVGRYYAGLIQDQLTITDGIAQALADILKTVPNKKDRLAIVKAVYGFVVNRTRYVGLEFGIHSFKPYPAHKVLSRRFGDCKDKASLMHVLLKAAGIDSSLVLLRTSRHGDLGQSPASLAAFNHAILYVPEFDLFLDGTAELHGPEELPHQDCGTLALIVSPDGTSKITTTPLFSPSNSVNQNVFTVALAKDGSAFIQGTSTHSGQLAPRIRHHFQAPAIREHAFELAFSPLFPGMKLKSVTFSDMTDIFSDPKITFALDAPRFAERGQDGSLHMRPFGHRSSYVGKWAPLGQRQLPLKLAIPDTRIRDVTIQLPEGMTPQQLPGAFHMDTPRIAFDFEAFEENEGKGLRFKTNFTIKVHRVATEDYPAFRDELQQVDDVLNGVVTLVPRQDPSKF